MTSITINMMTILKKMILMMAMTMIKTMVIMKTKMIMTRQDKGQDNDDIYHPHNNINKIEYNVDTA